MKNKIWLVLVAVMVLALSVMGVSAAVTECVDASGNPQAGSGAYPMYNDTGTITNVTLGQICVDATSYDVAPNVTYNCGNASAMIDNACTYTTHYTGFLGDGTATCTNVGWVTGTTYTLGEGYIVNTTINASWATRGDYITNTGESASYDACSNAYTRQGPDGYCDGGGALDMDDALLNVSAGNVCIAGADTNPTASVFCSDSWANYTDGACKYTRFYVGYVGDGTTTCVATDWVVRTQNVFIAADYIINTTIDGLISGSYVTNTGESASYDACLNAYTRMGPDGYCDGGGALDTNGSTLHVTEGNVCSAGANAQPGAGIKCSTWYDCVQGATLANTYYVGYAASGSSCSDTDWVATGLHVDLAGGLRARYTDHESTLCSTSGYNAAYNKGDFQPIVTDAMGTAGAGIVSWADLAVTLLVVLFLGGAVLKYKKLF